MSLLDGFTHPVRPTIAVAATLIVGKCSSDCSQCMCGIDDWETAKTCPTCGVRFTTITSIYEGQADWADAVYPKRPDLRRIPAFGVEA